MREDPLVEALEPGREQGQPLLRRELLDHRLRQLPPLRRQRNHAVRGRSGVHGIERRGDDVDAQHHARAASVRVIVDLAAGERRVVAVAEQAQLELAAEYGGHGPLLRQPRERVRNQSEDVELQRRPVSA